MRWIDGIKETKKRDKRAKKKVKRNEEERIKEGQKHTFNRDGLGHPGKLGHWLKMSILA